MTFHWHSFSGRQHSLINVCERVSDITLAEPSLCGEVNAATIYSLYDSAFQQLISQNNSPFPRSDLRNRQFSRSRFLMQPQETTARTRKQLITIITSITMVTTLLLFITMRHCDHYYYRHRHFHYYRCYHPYHHLSLLSLSSLLSPFIAITIIIVVTSIYRGYRHSSSFIIITTIIIVIAIYYYLSSL